YRTYARNVRQHVIELGLLEPEEREVSLVDRQEELADLSNDLRRTARVWWRRPLGSLAIGAAGAAWMAAGPSHDTLGAALALAGAAYGAIPNRPAASAYSYIFEARDLLGSHSSYVGWSRYH